MGSCCKPWPMHEMVRSMAHFILIGFQGKNITFKGKLHTWTTKWVKNITKMENYLFNAGHHIGQWCGFGELGEFGVPTEDCDEEKCEEVA